MTAALRDDAPAKLNLCLFLGPTRPEDGRHALVTVFQALGLADRVALEPAPFGARADALICPGVAGPPEDNLAARALQLLRERAGWDGPPVRMRIDKRIPVAGGLAGGSADAGAALRLAARTAGIVDDALLLEVATELGADVPAQVRPGRHLATGAGECLEPLPAPRRYGVVLLPAGEALPTADVYRAADRLGLPRTRGDLADRLAAVRAAGPDLPGDLIVNDLEPAARALCATIGENLAALRSVGADRALVCGSGPTVAGLFTRVDAARGAAVALGDRVPRPIVTEPYATSVRTGSRV